MSDDHDERLLREFQSGDEGAFDRLVRRHQDVIYRLALRHLCDEDLAVEATQEVFIRAWRKLPRWKPGPGSVFTWPYRTTTMVCRELGRGRQRLRLGRPLCDVGDIPDDRGLLARDTEEAVARLQSLVRRLPPRQQDVVWLHAYEGLALKDVAAALGIPLGTVKSNYHKALCSLRVWWSILDDAGMSVPPTGGVR
ncbi:MAG: sigma-70 family RNA polymerase sigma factor [Candidatus Eisenbacteria bacterium]|nr:sigma-70 family RNA polymerase sigma factor [Candidatus Eisenbacteria bacterium]